MKKTKYPNEETRLFMEGMKRRRDEWKCWRIKQIPIVVKFLMKAQSHALRGKFEDAKKAAWNAGQAIHEMDNVWIKISAEGNTFIKTIPKGWKKRSEKE